MGKTKCIVGYMKVADCCAVTLFEYSSTDVKLLPSCLSEQTRCFAKQMAECRFRPPKTSEVEEKSVPALFRGNVCIWSDTISANVRTILGRKCTARLKVNQNTRLPPLSESLSNISKTSASVSSGFQTREKLMKARGRRPSAFIVFECLKPR